MGALRYYPKRYPDPFSRFATIHFPDKQAHTRRQTDRWSRRLGQ